MWPPGSRQEVALVADVVSDSIVINADPDTIMEVIADFEAYPDWQDEIKEAEILETDDDGWGTRVRYRVSTKVAQARYVLDYTYTDDAMRWTLVEGDNVKRNDGEYHLADQGDGSTEVSYELVLESPIKVPGVVKRQLERRVVATALGALKKRVARA
jgi:uncharacterized membrane protein